MIPIAEGLVEYLEETLDGYKVKENCPADKLQELKQLDKEYRLFMGRSLFIFDTEE
jgi:hypothetical protein